MTTAKLVRPAAHIVNAYSEPTDRDYLRAALDTPIPRGRKLVDWCPVSGADITIEPTREMGKVFFEIQAAGLPEQIAAFKNLHGIH